jgi:hypothetical protein
MKLSMILIAFASAATASTITTHEISTQDSRKSSGGTLMRAMAMFIRN